MLIDLIFSIGNLLWALIVAYATIAGILSMRPVVRFVKNNPHNFVASVRYYLIDYIWKTKDLSVEESEAVEKFNKPPEFKDLSYIVLKPSLSGEIRTPRIPMMPAKILRIIFLISGFIFASRAFENYESSNTIELFITSLSCPICFYIFLELTYHLKYRAFGTIRFHIISDRFVVEAPWYNVDFQEGYRIKEDLKFSITEEKEFFLTRKNIVVEGTTNRGFCLISIPSVAEAILMREPLDSTVRQLNSIVEKLNIDMATRT